MTERMTEHYSHVDIWERRPRWKGCCASLKGGAAAGGADQAGHVRGGPKQAVS